MADRSDPTPRCGRNVYRPADLRLTVSEWSTLPVPHLTSPGASLLHHFRREKREKFLARREWTAGAPPAPATAAAAKQLRIRPGTRRDRPRLQRFCSSLEL